MYITSVHAVLCKLVAHHYYTVTGYQLKGCTTYPVCRILVEVVTACQHLSWTNWHLLGETKCPALSCAHCYMDYRGYCKHTVCTISI